MQLVTTSCGKMWARSALEILPGKNASIHQGTEKGGRKDTEEEERQRNKKDDERRKKTEERLI